MFEKLWFFLRVIKGIQLNIKIKRKLLKFIGNRKLKRFSLNLIKFGLFFMITRFLVVKFLSILNFLNKFLKKLFHLSAVLRKSC